MRNLLESKTWDGITQHASRNRADPIVSTQRPMEGILGPEALRGDGVFSQKPSAHVKGLNMTEKFSTFSSAGVNLTV